MTVSQRHKKSKRKVLKRKKNRWGRRKQWTEKERKLKRKALSRNLNLNSKVRCTIRQSDARIIEEETKKKRVWK